MNDVDTLIEAFEQANVTGQWSSAIDLIRETLIDPIGRLLETARDLVDALDAHDEILATDPPALIELRAELADWPVDWPHKPRPAPNTERLRIGELVLDVDHYQAWRADRDLGLTRTEFEVLAVFARHPTQILTRSQLYQQVWNANLEDTSNALGMVVSSLRRKLSDPPLILTVYGIGYRLVPPAVSGRTVTIADVNWKPDGNVVNVGAVRPVD